MIATTINAVETIATVIGGVVLFTIGIAVVGRFALNAAYLNASDEAKQLGTQMERENGYDAGASAMIVDGVLDAIDEMSQDIDIRYDPGPAAHFDWSMSDQLSPRDVRRVRAVMEKAGLYVHPFPVSPDEWRPDRWRWSDGHMGVWTEPPTWYVETDDERTEIEPDLSDWEPVTNSAEREY